MLHQRLSRPTPGRFAGRQCVIALRPVGARAAAGATNGWQSKDKFADWESISKDLMAKQLKTVSPQQAQELVNKQNYIIVDVRAEGDFEAAHPEGAVNAPLFSLINWERQRDVRSILKYVACALNGVTPVFYNTNFLQDVAEVSEGYKGIIIACEAGGTLETSANFPAGKVSRSLKAAHRIMMQGNLNVDVKHLEAGVYGWSKAELPFVGEYDDSNVGRTPNAAYKGLFTDFKKGEGA